MSTNPFIWLLLIPLAAAPLVYLVGRIGVRLSPSSHPVNPARWVSLAALLAAWIPFYQSFQWVSKNGAVGFSIQAIEMRADGIGILLSGVALGLCTLVALFSGPYLKGENGEEKYYALLLVMAGSIIGLGFANDLFNLWVWFETMAIASFMLVAFYREEKAALEAGIKYLVQSATGSALILLGIALVFGLSGTLSLEHLPTALRTPAAYPALLAAGALFIIGFGVKAALVPLHTWLPDAHSQAPSGISAMLSGIVIGAGLIAMLRAIEPLFGFSHAWGPLLIGFGAANMLLGNLLALRQEQVKRLLAFSSISHMGYILLGLGLAITFGSLNGAQGAFFHLLNHGLMKGLAFLAAGTLLYVLFTSHGSHAPLTRSDLAGAATRYPIITFTLSIALLALGGLPPFSGFMSKWQIFVAGFQTQNAWAMVAVIFAALNSVISLGYYAPLVNLMYRRQPSEAVKTGLPVPVGMVVPLVVMAAAIVLLGVMPSLANGLTLPASKALLAIPGALVQKGLGY